MRSGSIGVVMTRTVYLENWHLWIPPTIDALLLAAGQAGSNSADRETLLAEKNAILEMVRQVRDVEPAERTRFGSPLLHATVHDATVVPAQMLEHVGEIHDIYRRFRDRLVWPETLDSPS